MITHLPCEQFEKLSSVDVIYSIYWLKTKIYDMTPFEFPESVVIPIVGLDHLKHLKQAAGRPRDLLDLEELKRIESETDGKS